MKKIWLTALYVFAFVTIVVACSVPVFRYALERWQADSYALIVVHVKALTDTQKKAVDVVNSFTRDEGGFANVYATTVNILAETNSPVLRYIPEKHPAYPAMFLFYPRSFGKPKIIWQAELNKNNAEKIVSSKLRQELTDEILRGRTTTWLLVESGDKEQDDKAYNTMKKTLTILQEAIVLPAGVATTSGDVTGVPEGEEAYIDPINQLRFSIPLQISFSIVKLAKDNKDEEVLRRMLINMKDDLHEYADQTMVYPVFGRGRILKPLIGEGITEDNITDMTYYLGGACSCEVKAQNPGIDLLFNVNWDSRLDGYTVVEDRELPPLSGIADIIGQEPAPVPEDKPEEIEEVEEPVAPGPEVSTASPMRRNIAIVVMLVILLLAGSSAAILRKNT